MKRDRSFLKKERWSIEKFLIMSGQGSAISLMTIYCVNAAPCRMLAWGKSLLNVKGGVSPTGPDHTWIIVWKPDGQEFSCCTHLPVGCRLTLWEIRKNGDWTLGSKNVEEGLHSPFPVKTKLDRVTQNYQLLCPSS